MKKIFLFLTISLFSIPAMYAVVTWDGTSSEMWTQGTGTEADPYLIETPANLAYLSAQVTAGKTYAGVYFQQTEDFDLQSKTWTPIGTSTYKFAGIYDGGNKFISNLTNSIFGSIIDATIMNITLQGVDINTNENNTAILVERTFDDCKITNCHNKINIKITVSKTYSSMTLYCGGIVSHASGLSLYVEGCSNKGNITISNPSSGRYDEAKMKHAYAGGIVGYSNDNTFINACCNMGNIFVSQYTHYQYSYDLYTAAAGIIGGGMCDICEQCYNTGSISAAAAGYTNASGSPSNKVIVYGIGPSRIHKACYVISDANGIVFGAHEVESCYAIGAGTMPSMCSNVYHNQSSITNGTYKSDIAFKDPSMISLLNTLGDYFTMDLEGINDGYPILKWQAGPRFTITGSCDANRGTVKGGGEYAPGNTVTLTATPKKGCTFVGWSDGVTDNPRTVTVEGDATYRAQFIKSSYTIYVNQDCTNYIE